MKIPRPGLTAQILAGLFLGGLIGFLWPAFGQSLKPLATIFIRLIFLILAPLVFAGLVVGIADSSDGGKFGSTTLKTFGFYFVITGLALALGMGLGYWLEPGAGVNAGGAAAGATLLNAPGEPFWLRIIPSSSFDAMARNDVLQLVIVSLLFAIALGRSGEKGKPLIHLCRSLLAVMLKLTDIIMLAAPLGVLGAAAAMVGQHGLAIGENLLRLILTVYLGLAIVSLLVFPLLIRIYKIPFGGLFRAAKDPVIISFATTTGAAAYPLAFTNLEAFGIPRKIASLVIFTAYFNFAGSSIFIGATAMFVLQAFHVPLPLSQVVPLFTILFLATKAVGPVPRGSLVALAAGLTSFGLPPENVALGFGLLLGVDPIMDMPRTAVNMANNFVTASLVARWEGTFQNSQGKQPADLPTSSL